MSSFKWHRPSGLCFIATVLSLPATAQTLTLDSLERMALTTNPAIAQAAADTRAAAARARQSSLYPNPTVGVSGAGSSEWGGFAEQRILTAGKRGLDRSIAETDRTAAAAMEQTARQRVLNTVRALYYQALGDQQLVKLRTDMLALARKTAAISSELGNIGQLDRPDQIAATIEAQRAELNLRMAENARARTWRQLAIAVNQPQLTPAPLQGDLEKPPQLPETLEADTLSQNPQLHAAEILGSRATLATKRAEVEKIPDLMLRAGARYNRDLDLKNGVPTPSGTEALVELSIQIPIFNRNQGAVEAAKAEAERSTLEAARVKLMLRAHWAGVFKEYRDAMQAATAYRDQMIPGAQQAYDLNLASFKQMAATYPSVLMSQKNLFQLQEDYITSLVRAWQSAVELQGLLL